MNIKQSNKGFSLVELAIGLAVITVLILAISMSSGIRDTARVQSAVNSIQALRSAAESYLASGKINYSGMDVAALKTNNLLPTNFNATGTNPWGGNYAVAPNATPTKYDITLGSVAAADSTKLTSYYNNLANTSAYDATAKTWTVTF